MSLPKPHLLGLPGKFTSWRPGQPEAIWGLLDSEHRYSALVLPTGSGKSLTYMSYAILSGHGSSMIDTRGRTVILTSTKNLQDQINDDFAPLDADADTGGFADVRGKSNYICLTDSKPGMVVPVSEGSCHVGIPCDLRDKAGCHYYDAIRKANASKIVVTNYSWWLAQRQFGGKAPPASLLVLDEAHAAPDELAGFLSVWIGDGELGSLLQCRPAPYGADWYQWARLAHIKAEALLEDFPHALRSSPEGRRRYFKLQDLTRRLLQLRKADPGNWVQERTRAGFRWDVCNPAPYVERLLFGGAERIVLVSATIREKTMSLLGIEPGTYDFMESGSSFPVKNRRVYIVPSVRLTYRSTPEELKLWCTRIDQIIDRGGRGATKGIIHTVSYDRAQYLANNSRHRARFILHETSTAAAILHMFKTSNRPLILVSPSMTTGVDFPYDQCRWQIIAKVPFPDQRSVVLKARSKSDHDYPMYLAALEIVQAAGRGVRAADDFCETFIVDDQVRWFLPKYRRFFPRWFLDAVVWLKEIPT